MKRVNYIFSIAACLAALLTSCVKEEAYKLETLNLEVNVTRAGGESEQQGDKIEDVMIWAFPMEGTSVVDDAAGWRTYTPTSNTYTSVTVHIPLPMCNGSANYRLVAIINKGEFGEIVVGDDDKELTLNGDTKYSDLINARFESDVVNASLSEDNPGTPAVMPVSHWCDVTVDSGNTHTLTDNQYQCKKVDMPVFRAVAKTQLFVARNNQFQLEVHEVTLVNAAAEEQGVILSQTNDVNSPSWFISPTLTTSSYSSSLVSSSNVYKIDPDDATNIYNDNSTLKEAPTGHGVAHYICGKVLYETAKSCTYTDGTYQNVPTGNGYYYKITYKIGNNGTPQTRYVPLPPIVRNHDYQVRALVDAGGKLDLTLTVNEWQEKLETHNYLNEVSIPQGGQIQWEDGVEPDEDGKITLGAAANNSVSCTFYLNTPANGTWQAELVTVQGQEGAITFADGTTKATGAIAGSEAPAELTIKTTKDNSLQGGAVSENHVQLRITATATVGGVQRTYKVTGLTGTDGVPYYTIVQTR